MDSPGVSQTQEKLIELTKHRLAELAQELQGFEERRHNLEKEIERLRREMTYLEGFLRIHEGPSGEASEPTIELQQYPSLADMVVDLLREAGEPLHYREIEKRLRAKGLYKAGGRDPANTLLAHYFNDPRLFRPRRGTYALREWQPDALSVGTRRRRGRLGKRRA
ncbi:MAG TPA: winged helix-turn-helix domain-containing protein [Dehalococcoidia bacterium]|nr:winged helix-turn-helix domain-containing protein [Dehalococcoidia bacterium]